MSVLRDKTTATVQFRGALEQIAILLLTEASKHWPTLATEIDRVLTELADSGSRAKFKREIKRHHETGDSPNGADAEPVA